MDNDKLALSDPTLSVAYYVKRLLGSRYPPFANGPDSDRRPGTAYWREDRAGIDS